jgi:DNA-binding response OmpR family regulator
MSGTLHTQFSIGTHNPEVSNNTPGYETFFYNCRRMTSVVHTRNESEPDDRIRLLLVDDDPGVLLTLTEFLVEDGYDVETACDGVSALQLLSQPSASFDILITDVGLPGLDGGGLAKASRVLRPSLKILFITGHLETNVLSEMQALGQTWIIMKPFSLMDLKSRLTEIVGR